MCSFSKCSEFVTMSVTGHLSCNWLNWQSLIVYSAAAANLAAFLFIPIMCTRQKKKIAVYIPVFCLLIVGLVFSGEGLAFLAFAERHPGILAKMLTFGLASAAGQVREII